MVKNIVISIFLLLQFGKLFTQTNNDSILFNERMKTITGSKGIVRLNEDIIENIEEVVIYDEEKNINIRFSFKNNYFILLDTLYDLFRTPNSKNIYDFDHFCHFNPMSFNFEPNLVLFECKEEIEGYWRVYLNKEHSIMGLIKQNTDLFYFKNWYEHFMCAMINPRTNNIIKKEPFDNSDTINFNENDTTIYIITEIKGDWIKIECLSEFLPCPEDKLSGWTKWIENNKIIIELAFYP